jgi:4-amino-4-deoxy-L-arabinose transferase-like glycosyltransferase
VAIAAAEAADTDRAARLTAFAVVLAALFFALRLWAAGNSGLFFDETYYWHWSTNLSPGYFDHPPMVALFIRAGTLLFGDTSLGVRFMTALATPVGTWVIWAIALGLTGSRRIAAWAAIFSSLTGAALLSVAVFPDEPMVLFWLVATLALVKLHKGGAPWWWIVAGVAIGLSGDSKYTAVFLGLGLFAWTVLTPGLRRWYGTRWPWLGLVAALVVTAPVLLWNAGNGWPSLAMQTMRDGLGYSQLTSLLTYLSLIPQMASPAIFLLAVVGLVRGPNRVLLGLAVLPIIIFLALFSQSDEVTLNSVWPIAAWAPLPAAIAMATRRFRWVTRGLAGLALLIGLLIPAAYVLLALPPGVAPDRLDVGKTFRGWPSAAMGVQQALDETGATYVVGDRYFYPGYLKMTLGRDTPVFHLVNPDYDTEYSLWRRWRGFPSASAGMADDKAIFIGSATVAALYYDSISSLAWPAGASDERKLPLFLVAAPKPETMPLFNNWQAP